MQKYKETLKQQTVKSQIYYPSAINRFLRGVKADGNNSVGPNLLGRPLIGTPRQRAPQLPPPQRRPQLHHRYLGIIHTTILSTITFKL